MRTTILDIFPMFRRRASLDPEPDVCSRRLRYREGKIQVWLARTTKAYRSWLAEDWNHFLLISFILYIDQQMHNQ